MIDEPSPGATGPPTNGSAPPARSVPEVEALDADSGAAVTDEDRQRFGVLLDRAAERGLLSSADYDVKLGELAAAASVEEMTAIVTDLPAFRAARPTAASKRTASKRTASKRAGSVPVAAEGLGPSLTGGARSGADRGRTRSWWILVVIVLVIVASLLVLAVYAHHTLSHRGTAPPVGRTMPAGAGQAPTGWAAPPGGGGFSGPHP